MPKLSATKHNNHRRPFSFHCFFDIKMDVDPRILIAAGTAVIGFATVAVCMRPAKTSKAESSTKRKSVVHEQKTAAAPATSAPVAEAAVKKGKKKVRSSKKKKSTSTDNLAAESSAPDSASDAEPETKPQDVSVSAIDFEEEDELPVFSNKAGLKDAQKQKKAKETPEQKAARAERLKIKEAKRAAAEEKNAAAAAKLAAEDADFNNFSSASPTTTQPFDGWAVVEVKKSKAAKKDEDSPEAAAAAPAVPAPVAAVPEAPAAPAQPVIETVTVPMTVDSKKLGLLIGPKGATKIGIQNATGATIEMPKVEKDAAPSSVIVNVSGTEASVARAIHALNELCVKGYSLLLAGDDFQEGYVAIHPR